MAHRSAGSACRTTRAPVVARASIERTDLGADESRQLGRDVEMWCGNANDLDRTATVCDAQNGGCVEAMSFRPVAPRRLDARRGVHEHTIQVEQHGIAGEGDRPRDHTRRYRSALELDKNAAGGNVERAERSLLPSCHEEVAMVSPDRTPTFGDREAGPLFRPELPTVPADMSMGEFAALNDAAQDMVDMGRLAVAVENEQILRRQIETGIAANSTRGKRRSRPPSSSSWCRMGSRPRRAPGARVHRRVGHCVPRRRRRRDRTPRDGTRRGRRVHVSRYAHRTVQRTDGRH